MDEGKKVPEMTEGIWQRNPERAVDNGEHKRPGEGRSAEEGSEGRVKDELAFLVAFGEVSRKIHPHDSLQMRKKLHKIVT